MRQQTNNKVRNILIVGGICVILATYDVMSCLLSLYSARLMVFYCSNYTVQWENNRAIRELIRGWFLRDYAITIPLRKGQLSWRDSSLVSLVQNKEFSACCRHFELRAFLLNENKHSARFCSMSIVTLFLSPPIEASLFLHSQFNRSQHIKLCVSLWSMCLIRGADGSAFCLRFLIVHFEQWIMSIHWAILSLANLNRLDSQLHLLFSLNKELECWLMVLRRVISVGENAYTILVLIWPVESTRWH